MENFRRYFYRNDKHIKAKISQGVDLKQFERFYNNRYDKAQSNQYKAKEDRRKS